MKSRSAAMWSAWVRPLLQVCLLAGVLAMHALTMNHDTGIAHISGASVAESEPAVISGHGSHDDTTTDLTTTQILTQSVGDLVAGSPSAHPSSRSDAMGKMCVAVLGAGMLVVLALLVAWLRSARAPRWIMPRQVVPPALPGRSPPWLAPSLSKLCVLRT